VAKQAFLVDDSKSARIVLGRLLKKNGFDEVAMAESGEQALEQLKSLTPDAIFVDFLMDGMDGLETISEIKKDQRFVNTPVVMCTANEGERYIDAAVDHGALGILAKPPTDDSLKQIIELIERQGADASPAVVTAPAEKSSTVVTAVPPAPQVKPAAAPAGLSDESIRNLAAEAARTSAETVAAKVARKSAEMVAAGVAQEKADAIAREVAKDTVSGMLEPLVSSLVEQRLAEVKPPEVDVDGLRDNVVSQLKQELEDFVRQVNERTVEGLIEASIYQQVQELTNDFAQRLENLKEDILSQVPEKNDMIEHIRVVTEGSLEAQVRETASQVSREVANSTATETVEHILDEHLANQANIQAINKSRAKNRWWIWLLLLLLGAGAGYGVYFFKLLPLPFGL
jgi:CheY-like chemotaxis protein